jgi:hypothetical protein
MRGGGMIRLPLFRARLSMSKQKLFVAFFATEKYNED